MHRGVAFFMVVWFAILCMAVVGMLAAALLVEVVPVLVIMGIGAGIVGFGRWLARDEKSFLIDFVRGILAVKGP